MRKDLEAQIYIRDRLEKSSRPVVLCSFGKDSVALLHLVRQIKADIPVVFLREPFYPKKNRFANRIIEDWGLEVYDFPPVHTGYIARGNEFEVVNWYTAYGGAYLYLPTGTHPYKTGEQYLCAVKDLIGRPKAARCIFPWDTIFVGHKRGDFDAILGETSLTERTVKLKKMTLALPIMNWTDKDVWDYTIENEVPFNEQRYNAADGFKEFEDKTFNNDFYPCCFKCLDNHEAATVVCSKSGACIKNTGRSVEVNEAARAVVLELAGYVGVKE